MRRLRENEIMARIDRFSNSNNGQKPMYGFLFLYIDARTAQQMLDDEYGPTNWKCDYTFGQTSAICNLSVFDKEKKEWVTKQDVGNVGSNGSTADATKTMASDAFKRAAVLWGVGRELYFGPKVMFDTTNVNMKEYKGKWQTYDTFVVRGIDYDSSGNITALSIYDQNTGRSVYEYDVRPNELTKEENEKFAKMFEDKGYKLEDIANALNIGDFKNITRKQVRDVLMNPSIIEPQGEKALENLPNTSKGFNNQEEPFTDGAEGNMPGDFMNIEDIVDDEIPFK